MTRSLPYQARPAPNRGEGRQRSVSSVRHRLMVGAGLVAVLGRATNGGRGALCHYTCALKQYTKDGRSWYSHYDNDTNAWCRGK